MKNSILSLLALAALPTSALLAQNIADTWQGTLIPPQAQAQGRPPLRIVMKITREPADESLKATVYSIDQNPTPIGASAVSLQGSTFKMTVAAIGATYEGKLSSDGNTIVGTMTQGGGPIAMEWARATPKTAWVIPEPPAPPKVMATNVKPAFEVSTIKPARPDAQGRSILVNRSGMLNASNTPVVDLIIMAYGLHPRQLSGVPAWIENDKWDISGKPDQEGVPNVDQLKEMIKGLLADRFGLKFHLEKKELSVYAITIAKSGLKITKNDPPGGNLPGFGGPPGRTQARNTTMAEFAGFLQSRIVEQPVVDQTGLGADRYNVLLKWIPAPSQLAQLPPGVNVPPPDDDAAPDFFAAMQQQAGLKLESTKAPVDVMVIDKVEKPSEN